MYTTIVGITEDDQILAKRKYILNRVIFVWQFIHRSLEQRNNERKKINTKHTNRTGENRWIFFFRYKIIYTFPKRARVKSARALASPMNKLNKNYMNSPVC